MHKFSNFDNGYLDSAPSGFIQESSTPYQPYNSNAFQRGKLLEKGIYFQNGNPASKVTYQYGLVGPLATYSARGVKANLALLCNTDNRVYEATAYIISTQRFLPSQEINYIYDQDTPSSFVTMTRNNTYKDNGQLWITDQSDSKGKKISTGYTYPYDYVDAIHGGMTSKNILSVTNIGRQAISGSTVSNLKDQVITYDLINGFYLPTKVESSINLGGNKTEVEFLTYDSRGNLLTFKEGNGIATKLEYYGTAEVGKTDLIKKKTIADGATIPQSTSYDYKPLVGVSSVTDANSKANIYDYDDFNRLQTIKNSLGSAKVSYCYNYAGQSVPCTTITPFGSIAATSLVLITPGALPVTLVEFEAIKKENTALLTWSTTMEANSERFDIERSKDGKKWNNIGTLASKGESNNKFDYSFTDKSPSKGENLYRLKMIDKDGTFAYSRIRSVSFDSSGGVVLYPNPVTIGEKLTLQTDDLTKITEIRIFDTNGKLVHKSSATTEINTNKLATGLYVVQILFTDGSISNHRVVKQ